MRIFYPPAPWAILLSILLWPLLQYGAAWICHRLPDRVYRPDSWLFRSRSFEKGGRLYERLFRISRWKDLLPEGSIARKEERFSKKHLGDRREEGLRRYLLESARGELTHWLAIPCFLVFGLFIPPEAMGWMVLYALAANLPFILVQRYNRPRILRLLENMKGKTAGLDARKERVM